MSARIKQALETEKGIHVRAIETIDAQLAEIDKPSANKAQSKPKDKATD